MPKSLDTQLQMKVPFYDVDSFRIVWHGNYPKYFEVARCQLLDLIGYPYKKMEETGYFFPVIDLQVRYIQTIKFEQEITVTAILKSWETTLVIDYVISDTHSGQRLTRARTTQVAVLMPDQITQYQTPPELIEKIQAAQGNLTQ